MDGSDSDGSPRLLTPPLPSLQLGPNRWWREQRAPACCFQGHSSRGVFIPTWGQNPGRTGGAWEAVGGDGDELSWHCLHKGPGLATEERSGACQVVDEMQGLESQRKQNEGTTCQRHFNFSCVWEIWRLIGLSQIKKIGYWCFAGGREKSPDL